MTGQVVPQGAHALNAAREDIAAQLAAAGLEAQITISEIEGYVGVRPADVRAISDAAVAGKIDFPALVRLTMDNQSAVYRQDIPIRSDHPAVMENAGELDQEACYRAVLTRDGRFDGRFFGCVKTTGIYCRPVCPARTPKRGNMSFVVSAAAAEEAGFRACLRCRPETAPDMGCWRGETPRG